MTASCVGSIVAHPCKERKDGAPSVVVARANSVQRVGQPPQIYMDLEQELKELDRLKPHVRGRRFESLIAAMLEEEGFEVTRNPRIATRGRQTFVRSVMSGSSSSKRNGTSTL